MKSRAEWLIASLRGNLAGSSVVGAAVLLCLTLGRLAGAPEQDAEYEYLLDGLTLALLGAIGVLIVAAAASARFGPRDGYLRHALLGSIVSFLTTTGLLVAAGVSPVTLAAIFGAGAAISYGPLSYIAARYFSIATVPK